MRYKPTGWPPGSIMPVIALGAFLSACAGTPEVRTTVSLAAFCTASAEILNELALTPLSAKQVSRVNQIRPLIRPWCPKDGKVVFTSEDVLDRLQAHLDDLRTVK